MNKNTILGIIFLTLVVISGCATNNENTTGKVVYEDDYVKIPVSDISEKATHYSFDTNNKEVRYFIVKGSDGEIRTAFDACDVCGGYKGYRQEGDDMVCNNCGRSFSIDSIGTANKGGGCWPSYLSHKIEGEYVLISKSELAGGAFRF